MIVNSKLLAIILLVTIFGGIALASALGYWNTEGGGGYRGGQGTATGSKAEMMVRGRTTFQDLLNWGVAPSAIEAVLGGPLPAPTTRIKAYCDEHGLDFEQVREALQTLLPASP